MAEYFDILDDEGNNTGVTKLRTDVHKDGDWHRTVHIWIVNADNEVLLQKRSPDKDSHPNMWDISSAGHLEAGDNSLDGAVREIYEELGIVTIKSDLKLLGKTKTSSRSDDGFYNSEFSDIYFLRTNVPIAQIKIQAEEVADIKYVPLAEFKRMIADKDPTLLMHPDEFAMLFKELER